MLGKDFIPFKQVANFLGINAKDSISNMLDGEWDEDSINIRSKPQGGVGSRPGYTALTTASVGAAVAWTGFFQYRTSAKANYFIGGASDGKLYRYTAGAYQDIGAGFKADADARLSFAVLDDICVIADGDTVLRKYTGSGSAGTLGGTALTSDWVVDYAQRVLAHSTLDPRLLYYHPTISSVESGMTSILNFDEDSEEIVGACKQGADLLVFKNWGGYRVTYTGSEPIYTKDRLDAAIGPVNHWVIKELPDGRVMFFGSDDNFYLMSGNMYLRVGDNIKPYMQSGIASRKEYAVAGLLHEENQYWLSFSRLASSTTNDRTVVMDWSRPYSDRWGNVQFPWFVYSIPANCFAEVFTSGSSYLWHGGYTGKMYRDNSGTSDDGVAFASTYKSKPLGFGDDSLNKKFSKLFIVYDTKGDYELDISFLMDQNASTQKVIEQSMLGGVGGQSLFGVAKFSEDSFSGETDADVGRDIDQIGKLMQLTFGTDGLSEAWNVIDYTILVKGLRRGVIRGRES